MQVAEIETLKQVEKYAHLLGERLIHLKSFIKDIEEIKDSIPESVRHLDELVEYSAVTSTDAINLSLKNFPGTGLAENIKAALASKSVEEEHRVFSAITPHQFSQMGFCVTRDYTSTLQSMLDLRMLLTR